MPELPEVESLRRDLVPRLTGAKIASVWWSGKPLRMRTPVDVGALRAMTVGRRVVALRRRAKYLLIDTDAGGAVVVHLGMSGRLTVTRADAPHAPHTHVVFGLDRGRELRFVDPRRFGQVAALPPGGAPEVGVEPLGATFTAGRLAALLEATRRPIKALLLDQTRIAGLGNIYVCEALYWAHIHPSEPAANATAKAAPLRAAIRAVLRKGIDNRGTTIRDYTDSRGRAGRNQLALAVYGREGEPCPRCGSLVRRQVDSGRSTFFCPGCQILSGSRALKSAKGRRKRSG
jgi:formamidopyrimidine-DNA glycosylase